jgi:hypothetical protein
LADTVFAKTGFQRAVVEQLSQHYTLKTASPNEGHLLAAAMLREGAIASVVTLNFDLALSIAIAELGVGDVVGIVDGPDEIPNQKMLNLYYLHRNANTTDLETWILRTPALELEWKGNWEVVIAAKVLATPVVVFVGLGSPADVLIQSSKFIQSAIPEGSRAYQIDPGDPDASEFFKALALDPAFFIKGTWCEFMEALSQRLVVEHTSRLGAAAHMLVQQNGLVPEDLTVLLERLANIGLLRLGYLRSNWLLHDKRYFAEDLLGLELIADLLLAVALITRVTDTAAVLFENGIVEFRRGDRTVATHLFVSGRGVRSIIAIEAQLSSRQRSFRGLASPPTGAIVSGVTGNAAIQAGPPLDVVLGDTSMSILFGQSAIQMFHIADLRQDTARCQQVAP